MSDRDEVGRDHTVRNFALLALAGAAVIAWVWYENRPHPSPRRGGSPEGRAIAALRTLTTAQALFREGDKDGSGVRDYARDLEALQRAGLLDEETAMGTRESYRFRILAAGEETWSATAEPVEPSKYADRSFFVDETGVIRFSTSGPASATSTAIGG
jgi:hypothetical protein